MRGQAALPAAVWLITFSQESESTDTPHLRRAMKKLTLRVETLVVESFSTRAPEPQEGTVFAHSYVPCNTFDEQTCRNYNTCGGFMDSCNGLETCNLNCQPQPPIDHKTTTDPDANWTQMYC
jgi:hypothetical protein